jgi:hypothetical protein
MAINKRQDDNSVDEEATPTATYEYSLPPIYTPLPSKTATTPYVPINGFTTSIHSYTPIAEITDMPTPTRTTVLFYLPSYSPISRSVEPVNLPALPTSSPSPSPSPVQENKQGLSGGVIAGIVIGAVAGVVLVCYAIYVLYWSQRITRTTVIKIMKSQKRVSVNQMERIISTAVILLILNNKLQPKNQMKKISWVATLLKSRMTYLVVMTVTSLSHSHDLENMILNVGTHRLPITVILEKISGLTINIEHY